MKNIFLIIFLLAAWQSMEAQGVRRSTLSSIGTVSQQNGIRVSSSFGQMCVGCSVLESPDGVGFFRQGFQQPNADLSPCGFSSSIAIEPMDDECGTYYSFEYLGNSTSAEVEYTWDFGPNATPSTSTEQNPSMVVFAETGNFVVSVSVTIPDVCSEAVSANLTVEDMSFGALANTTEVNCFGDETGAIVVDYFGGTDPYSILWEDDPTADRLRTDLAAGSYPFTVTDANGCQFESIVTVDGPPTPITIVQIAMVPESCTDTQDGSIEIDIIGGAEGYELMWSNDENTLRNEDLTAGEYTVTVTDIFGCQGDSTFTVFNICEDGEDNLYDIISPNNDGVNDSWVIPGIENFPNNQVVIHNRWGELVWQSKGGYVNGDALNAFRGLSSDGNELPTGAYYFVIQYKDEAETVFGGAVTVIR
jgi:gliding motility-associated-like protein